VYIDSAFCCTGAAMKAACCVLLMAYCDQAYGHAAMTFPKPRNSLDGTLPAWKAWAYPCDETHKGVNCTITGVVHPPNCFGSCAISSHNGVVNALNGSNGQSCYWFNNGCTVGCESCDGTSSHVGHGTQSWLYKGMTSAEVKAKNISLPNPFNPKPGDMVLDPKSKFEVKPGCDKPNGQKATICASSLRSCNTQAKCGAPDDYYFYSPWRYPGSAPMIDSCGSAGGRLPGQPTGAAGAQYKNTSLAGTGDAGSGLPQMPPQATWKAGSSYEVGWTVAANHGGGYEGALSPRGHSVHCSPHCSHPPTALTPPLLSPGALALLSLLQLRLPHGPCRRAPRRGILPPPPA
jgi:hypothetical protein